jgi:hypothetical protein
MTAESKKLKTKPSNQSEVSNKRQYKRDEQEPTNPNAPKQRGQQGADQGVKPTQPPQEGGTGSADPKFDQTKPLADDWGKSDKH